ncbi:DAD family protein [Besnoitia besnoiti]|uniref:Dolichyl-diphosphooligosaccharide--protein glycosyltransferase subunit OST2 n=1 Tax=Besnoitia besnoiti TaxID=94643 RepID=A0A2A9MAS3_BESBE|nr:DAD family protein [Besnoitia besnoiti]PFH32482.1 DAD family protein [Besnoitia besnoiti]
MDAFCACLLFMASLLVMYAALTRTNFPFNAFLSAFISCTGTAVLTVCLRIQVCAHGNKLGNAVLNYEQANFQTD